MLRSRDVDLRLVAQTFKEAADAAWKAHLARTLLPLDKRSTLKLAWKALAPELESVARVLERWQELELAAAVRKVGARGAELFEHLPSDGVALTRFCEAARQENHSVIDLQNRLAALDPVGDPTFENIDGRSGVAVAIVFRFSKELRVKVRRLVCGHLRGTSCVWLSPTDFRYATDIEGERPGHRRLLCVNPDDPRRLLDEREQDLYSPDHRHRYEVYYYMLPGEESRLDLLMRIAWGLGSLAPRDSRAPEPVCFWMCATQARASYCGAAQVREDDAIFDNLSRIVSEEKLANCLLVPRTLLPAPSTGLGRWFAPAWRIPYQHRRDVQSNLECLWSTASFGGLPGEDLPTDLVSGGDDVEPVCWTPDHAKEEANPRRSYCRAAARLLLRRAVSCSLQLGTEELTVYLVDYSALGCRLLLPTRGVAWAKIKRAKATLRLPAGLPWPWEPAHSLCERDAPAQVVRHRVCTDVEALRNEQAQLIVGRGDLEVTLRFLWGARRGGKSSSVGSS